MADRDIHRAGIFVQARRGELNMTQEQLAAAAGVDEKTVRALEAGDHWPWPRNRVSIEKALGWEPLTLQRIAAGEGASPSAATIDLSVLTPWERQVFLTFVKVVKDRMAEQERTEGKRGA